MKIGVWLNPDYNPETGGGYSYYSRLIDGIDNYSFPDEIELCYIFEGNNTPRLNKSIIHLSYTPQPLSVKERIKCKIPFLRQKIQRTINQRNEKSKNDEYTLILQSSEIKIIFYPIPYNCPLLSFPFVITHWDIGHRSTFAFPEVSGIEAFAEREQFYNNILPKALYIFCESNAGKEELIHFTHLNESKIRVVHLFSGACSSIDMTPDTMLKNLELLNLENNQYFYYPAQFWAHKNHITLLDAFKLFLKKHPNYKMVFTGSNHGTLQYVKDYAKQLEINQNVVFAGFVSQEMVNTLYRNATAMVMPTLIGPTNMPLLEAMECGCPVICSDFPGHREELADSAIYVNPIDYHSIYTAMESMILEQDKYQNLILEQNKKCKFNINNALNDLKDGLSEAITIRKCWE